MGDVRLLVYEPEKAPYEKTVVNTLHSYQEIVGGYIETVPLTLPNGTKLLVICNEYGKMKGLRPNRYHDEACDVIRGVFFVCGTEGADFRSLTDEEIDAVREELP